MEKEALLHWANSFLLRSWCKYCQVDFEDYKSFCLKLVEEALSFQHNFRHQLWNNCYCFFRPINEKKAKWQLLTVGVKKQVWFTVFKRYVFYCNSCPNRYMGDWSFYFTTLMNFLVRYCRELFLKHLNIALTVLLVICEHQVHLPVPSWSGIWRTRKKTGKKGGKMCSYTKAGIQRSKFLSSVLSFLQVI